MVLSGELGEINAVRARTTSRAGCALGWKAENQKQAAWRTDPAKSGAAGCFGDIGTHAYNLARYMTGLLPETVSCNLQDLRDRPQARRLRPGRDPLRERRAGHASPPRRSATAARTICSSRSTAPRARWQWRQEEPNEMIVRRNGQPHAIYTRDPERPLHERSRQGRLPACRAATPRRSSRPLPTSIARPTTTWSLRATGKKFDAGNTIYPNVNDGVEGMYFIQQCVASSAADGAWVALKHPRARS